jgi:hypothetical protein
MQLPVTSKYFHDFDVKYYFLELTLKQNERFLYPFYC